MGSGGLVRGWRICGFLGGGKILGKGGQALVNYS